METSKKAYHTACKEEKLAVSREANSKADPALNPEQLKKLQDKVDKSKQDVLKVNFVFNCNVSECSTLQPLQTDENSTFTVLLISVNIARVFHECDSDS